jgi:flavin-binding protein dodecin
LLHVASLDQCSGILSSFPRLQSRNVFRSVSYSSSAGNGKQATRYNGSSRITTVVNPRRWPMSVAKIIEISCESTKSFEDAIQSGIARASKTVHNIKGAWVKEQQVVIENNKISVYRVDLKVTFVLD